MKMIKYPSIEQFRSIVKNVKDSSAYVGQNELNEAVFDYSKPQPIITFKGTVKLHGTNAGVTFDLETGELYAQSRENIITPEKDNAGFATFVYANKDYFKSVFEAIREANWLSDTDYISVYGEWAGKGIQKGVGISEIDKSFFIFGAKVTPKDEDIKAYWVDHTVILNIPRKERFYVIEEFETFSIDIDFNDPQRVQNDLIDITIKVEEQCPVSKAFGLYEPTESIEFSIDDSNNITCNSDIPLPVKKSIYELLKSSKLNKGEIYSIDFITD